VALRPRIYLVTACVLAAGLPLAASAQHITVDGRLAPAQTLAGPNYAIGANLGKQVGSNLFHSFGLFGLTTGESATFSGPATISRPGDRRGVFPRSTARSSRPSPALIST
jgi:large exoprotein involved in heme utilization and adhesion